MSIEPTSQSNLPVAFQKALICLCLILVTAAIYAPVRRYQFVNFDDDKYITRQPHVLGGLSREDVDWAFTHFHHANWHPVTTLSYMLDHDLWGLNAGGYHLTNVVFHIANAVLLFLILTGMTGALWRSALVAALFAWHPLHVESVAWISDRKDILSAFFMLLTLGAYVRYVETRSFFSTPFCGSGLPAAKGLPGRAREGAPTKCHGFYALTLAFYTLGLMSKAMIVTLPFVMLLLDYWPLGRLKPADTSRSSWLRALRPLVWEKLPLFVLAAIFSVVAVFAQRSTGALLSVDKLPLSGRITNTFANYVTYIVRTIWPTGLAIPYPAGVEPLWLAAGCAVALAWATMVALRTARRKPFLAVGWFWYLGMLVPVIGLVQVGTQSIADRYTYLPLIGLFIMVAWAVPGDLLKQPAKRLAIAGIAVVLLGACAVLSWSQVSYWKNTETLFRHSLKVTTNNWLAHYNLGTELAQEGRVPEALQHFEQVVRITPAYPEGHVNLGLALWKMGWRQEAIDHYERALRINPNFAEAHYSLGVALMQLGKAPEAIGQFEQTLRINPDYAEAHNDLALALWQAGQRTEAIAHWQRALQLRRDYAEAHVNLGLALRQMGAADEAMEHYERALRIKPDYMEAHFNLGMALWQAGKLPEAIEHFEQATRIKPDFAQAQYYLGLVLDQAGQRQKSIGHYEQALRIKPDYVEALNNLAWLLATLPTTDGGDPARALTLAERACQLTGSRQATYLDTLGVAYAAVGRFADAITAAQKAMDLALSAGQSQTVNEIETRLQLYREGRAYRTASP